MNYFFTIFAKIGQMLSMGVAIHLVFSVAGIFFLGFPTIMSIGAYALAISQKSGIPIFYSILLALFFVLIFSLIFAYLFVKVSSDSFAVLGLASYFAIQALFISWDSLTNGVLGISSIIRPSIFDSIKSLSFGIIFISIILLICEGIFLQTWAGRAILASKENPVVVQSLGISSNKLFQILIIISCFLFTIGGFFMVWQVQFLDPKFGGMSLMIEVLTIGILALKPQIKLLVFSVLFVVIIPEFIRFINFPQAMFGHLRILLYSVLLIILIKSLKNKLNINKRII